MQHGGEVAGMLVGTVAEDKLRAHILNRKQEAERVNWKWHEVLKPQSPPPMRPPMRPSYFLHKAIPPRCSQTVPPTGDQVFKCQSIWGTSHLNYHAEVGASGAGPEVSWVALHGREPQKVRPGRLVGEAF